MRRIRIPFRKGGEKAEFPNVLFVADDRLLFYDTRTSTGWIIPLSFPYIVVKSKLDVEKSLRLQIPLPAEQLVSPSVAVDNLIKTRDTFGTYYIHGDLTAYIEEQGGLRLYYPFPFSVPEDVRYIPYGVGVLGLHREGSIISFLYADPLTFRYTRGITLGGDIREGVRYLISQLQHIYRQTQIFARNPQELERRVKAR